MTYGQDGLVGVCLGACRAYKPIVKIARVGVGMGGGVPILGVSKERPTMLVAITIFALFAAALACPSNRMPLCLRVNRHALGYKGW